MYRNSVDTQGKRRKSSAPLKKVRWAVAMLHPSNSGGSDSYSLPRPNGRISRSAPADISLIQVRDVISRSTPAR